MIDAVLTGIFTKFSGSALATSLTNRMYSRYAPQNTTFPYAVVDTTSIVSDEYFTDQVEDIDILFNIFSKSTSEVEITGIFKNLIALYDNCNLTITGYTSVFMQRDIVRSLSDPAIGIRQYAIIYNLEIMK